MFRSTFSNLDHVQDKMNCDPSKGGMAPTSQVVGCKAARKAPTRGRGCLGGSRNRGSRFTAGFRGTGPVVDPALIAYVHVHTRDCLRQKNPGATRIPLRSKSMPKTIGVSRVLRQ